MKVRQTTLVGVERVVAVGKFGLDLVDQYCRVIIVALRKELFEGEEDSIFRVVVGGSRV